MLYRGVNYWLTVSGFLLQVHITGFWSLVFTVVISGNGGNHGYFRISIVYFIYLGGNTISYMQV